MSMPEAIPQIVVVEISKIKLGDRQREAIGDIPELAESIKKFGLFNPVIL